MGSLQAVLTFLMAIAALLALGLAFSQSTRRAAVRVGSMAPVAKVLLVSIVFLGLSGDAMADGSLSLGTGVTVFLYIGVSLALSPLLLALLALGLAFFPSRRRAAVRVSWIALVASVLLVLILYLLIQDVSRSWGLLALSTVPVYISLIALNLGLRGDAPPSKDNKRVFVFLVVAAVIPSAPAGYAYWREWEQNWIAREPSYQGIALSGWVTRYEANASHGDDERTAAERKQAADAIRHIGSKALPFLLAWTDAENVSGRSYAPAHGAATLAFGVLGPIAAPAIPELTRRTKTSQQWQAMQALCLLAPTAEPAMRASMCSPEWAAAPWAADSIHIMGPDARPLVPLLVQYLEHTNPKVAKTAAESLGYLKHEPNLVVPALAKSLDHPDSEVRKAALSSLLAFGELACGAGTPALVKALDDPDEQLARMAVDTLRKLKCKSDLVVPALVKGLDHPGHYVRQSTLFALEAYGDLACPAVPALLKALGDPDELAGRLVLRVLSKLKCEPDLVAPVFAALVMPVVARKLDHPDRQVRSEVLFSLIDFGERACPAGVPALARMVGDPDERLATYAVDGLGKLKCEPQLLVSGMAKGLDHAVQALIKRAGHPFDDVRTKAVNSLIALGGAACPAAVPALLKMLGGTDGTQTGYAADALGKLKCDPDLVVPALAKGLDHPDETLRATFVWALLRYGEHARPALPALRKALSDPDPYVRQLARNYLQNFDPEALTKAPPR